MCCEFFRSHDGCSQEEEHKHDIIVDAANAVREALEATCIDEERRLDALANGLSPCGGFGCDVDPHVIDGDNDQVDIAVDAPAVVFISHHDSCAVG